MYTDMLLETFIFVLINLCLFFHFIGMLKFKLNSNVEDITEFVHSVFPLNVR